MNILHIITGLTTGGAERALYNLLSGSLAESRSAAVLSLQDEGVYGPKIRSLGVPVYTLDMKRGISTPTVILRLRKLVTRLRPHLVQGWMYHGNIAASISARLGAGFRPVVAWNIRHSLYSLAAEKPLTRQIIRVNRWASVGADVVIYNSSLSRKQHEAFGFAMNPGQVIPNGFDTVSLFPDYERGQAARLALNMPLEAVVIGHVARFHPMKDHASFLRAVVDIMPKRPDVMCLLVGRDVDLQNPMLDRIVPPELESRFRIVGERDDVQDLMLAMDVFCQSSWSEAFPNVLGEAMALGVPCVATDVGDSRCIVGDTGEVVPPSDSDALARQLLSMLGRSAEERASLGQAGRQRIEERYALPKMVKQYSDLYTKLVSE
ncbi:glycosyltransferase [Marinobacter confluentis]|uniref:Glycosyltransferase n=1 Tax=Marinobacter confluentis TaxID=1697557 RepID=A0A4Z1C9B7_9GAMM|nr:glycosyltransferase [Marinobacter confluentis]TGN39936.1 glycosyltransferase [Marinobacter confluentis]